MELNGAGSLSLRCGGAPAPCLCSFPSDEICVLKSTRPVFQHGYDRPFDQDRGIPCGLKRANFGLPFNPICFSHDKAKTAYLNDVREFTGKRVRLHMISLVCTSL